MPADRGTRLKAPLKELRELLAAEVKRAQAGESPTPEGLSRLGAFISAVRYQSRLTAPPDLGVKMEPEAKNPAWVIAQIAESFANFLSHGDPGRLKACANPDCGWLFYDDSPASSRVWCDSRACGNLMKVRRFRARAKKER